MTNLPRAGLCLPWGWAGLGVACSRCHPHARACWDQTQGNPATLPEGKGVSETCSPCVFAPPERNPEVKFKFPIWLQALETHIPPTHS